MQPVPGMNLFYLHPDDRRWLKRWLKNNLVCFAAIVAFITLLKFASMVPEVIESRSRAGADTPSSTIPADPSGWRRTNDGWQHTSTWLRQPHRETSEATMMQPKVTWATIVMESLRRTSPLVIATMQIVAIGIILYFARRCQLTSSQTKRQWVPNA